MLRFENSSEKPVYYMGMSIEREENVWDGSCCRRGGVYELVHMAEHGAETAERLRAVQALGKSDDPRAVRPLVDLLADAEPQIRLNAVTALGHLRSGRPVDDLIERLRDRTEQQVIRDEAVVALAAIRSTGAIHGMREFIADEEEDPALRAHAEELLRNIANW